MTHSKLILENGHTFEGFSHFAQKNSPVGEVVFTTGMTGYVETLTDPSYAGQIVVFTYPLIGNYGVPDRSHWESKKIWATGVAVSEACVNWSHFQGTQSLIEWLKKEKIPFITNVDTRALTKHIRMSGTMRGYIQSVNPTSRSHKFLAPAHEQLVAKVSPSSIQTYGHGKKNIIVVDCGLKENIIRCLQEFPLTITRVPYNYDYTREHYDGIFLSNGPGDPADCLETIAILKKALEKKKPIFGICLGSQLLALAAGAKTYKLPFGHRGHNQPCQEVRTKKCVLTSQNHGYAIDEATLPKEWYVTFRNLNDGSVEGVAHKKLPFFSVQFHPEASPGPTDTKELFTTFFKLL